MSEHKKIKPAITVVETPKRFAWARRPLSRSGIVLICLVAVVVLLWAGGAWVIKTHRDNEPSKSVKAPVKQYSTDELRNMVVNSRQSNGDLTKTLEGQQPTDQNLRLLASSYVNNKQYDKAFAIYDKLIAKDAMPAAALQGAGESAEFLAHDNQRALTYYKLGKKKAEADKTDPLQAQNIQYFDSSIARVQAALDKQQ